MENTMRQFILSVLLLPALAIAEPVKVEKPVLCDTPKVIIEALSGGEYREEPFWVGNDDVSRYVMLVNEKTKTWSFVQFNKDLACVLGTGENHKRVSIRTKT